MTGSTFLLQDLMIRLSSIYSGGDRRIQGVRYGFKEPTVNPRLNWQAACESANSTAELAIQIRELDKQLQWDTLRPPPNSDPISNAVISQKRKAENNIGYDYFVNVPGISVVSHTNQKGLATQHSIISVHMCNQDLLAINNISQFHHSFTS